MTATARPPTTIRVLAWDHPRCTRPLEACASAYAVRERGTRIELVRRSLTAFGDELPQPGSCDLVLIDHPHVGAAVDAGALLPLDELLDSATLAAQAADALGPTHASYDRAGHHWALAVDAACTAAASHPALREAPTTWEDVLALARDRPGAVALPLASAHAVSAVLAICAAASHPPATRRLAEPSVLAQAVAIVAELARRGPPAALSWEPPDALGALAAGEVALVPATYAYVGYDVRWHAAPALAAGGRPGSVLGGAGIAALRGAADPAAAAAFAAFVADPQVQATLVADAGGQPAGRHAWDVLAAREPAGLFARVRSTIEIAWTRPRAAWWPAFQLAAGALLVAALRERQAANAVAAALERLYMQQRSSP